MTDDKPFLPFGKPMLDNRETEAISEVMASGILVHGKKTPAFEEAFAERIGSRHAVSVASCTAGLHLCLFVQDIGPGQRVAVPAMTHVATAHAVELTGATPVFVDVDPETGNMDPEKLALVEGDLAAVMVVHYLGLPCDMAALRAVAETKGARIIEDCALAVDATYDGAKAGTLGQAGCFSFYPIKHMTSIEGGMVTTNDEGLAQQIRQRRAFGYDRSLGERTKPGIYDVSALGFNYRMSDVEAAVGLVQLEKLDGFQAARKRNFEVLSEALRDVAELHLFPAQMGPARSSHYCFNVVLPKDGSLDRDQLAADLKADGIGTSVHYPGAVPLFAYYRDKYGHQPEDFPVADWLARATISLPVGPHLSEVDCTRIGFSVKQALARMAKAG